MSKDLNQFQLIGRLTRDAEMKYTSAGLAICSFSIAVSRSVKHGEKWIDEPSFFDMSIFGRRAEGVSAYLLKGQQVAVNGELKQDRWEKDGQKNSKVAFQVADLQLLGSGKNMRDRIPQEDSPKAAPAQRELDEPTQEAQQVSANEPGTFEDDIPF